MTLIILMIYLLVVVILTIFIVKPIAVNRAKRIIKAKQPENRVKAKKIGKKARIKVLFPWYVGIIVVGVVIGIVGFVLESTILTEYTLPAIIRNILDKKEDEEKDNEYQWGFDDYYETNEEEEGKPSYSSEAELFLRIAQEECDYYSSNNIRGGQKYWDWFNSLKGRHLEPPWDWCAGFMQYCATKAGLYESGTFGSMSANMTLGCTIFHDNITAGKIDGDYHYYSGVDGCYYNIDGVKTDYTPKPADIILYSKNNGASFGHVGIVEYTDATGNVHTIGGNEGGSGATGSGPSNTRSVVKRSNRGKGGLSYGYWNYTVYFTPNWVVTEKEPEVGGGTISGSFDISAYKKDSAGYYSGDVMFQMVYDFLRLECGYNSAAATGIVANMASESVRYNQLEVANKGKAYVSQSTSAKYYKVPSSYGNGNYEGIEDIDKTLWVTDKLYYELTNGFRKYGMGYGIFQWSFGRRVQMFNYASANGYGKGYGKDSFAGQLAYTMYEVRTNFPSLHTLLLNVPDTAQGAYDAAYAWHEDFEKSKDGKAASIRRGDLAMSTYWPIYGKTNPSVVVNTGDSANGAEGGASTSNIANVTVIGDSNTVRMYSYGTSLASANKIIATVGVGVNTFDSYTTDLAGRTTIPNKTIKSAINSCSYKDLNYVAIMLGTNDFSLNTNTFKTKYKELLGVIEAKNSTATVYVCTVPPVLDTASSTIKNQNATNLSESIRSVVSEYSGGLTLKLIDINRGLNINDMSKTNNDGYHLSSAGAKKCADLIATGVSS